MMSLDSTFQKRTITKRIKRHILSFLLLALFGSLCEMQTVSSFSFNKKGMRGIHLEPSIHRGMILRSTNPLGCKGLLFTNIPRQQRRSILSFSSPGGDSKLEQNDVTSVKVDQIRNDINLLNDDDEILNDERDQNICFSIKSTSDELERIYADKSNIQDDDVTRFEPLLGLYDVSYVQTANKGDNPVGGKWTRKNKLAQQIFSTRRTLQHLVPTNSTGLVMRKENVVAEAVNVISLDAFWKLLRLNIILRGDAVPVTLEERNSPKMAGNLSNLAVRAFFDAPRIILGKGKWLNLQLGPNTSVVLDTTYVDETVRIGKGGTSGTRFIFFRCHNKDEEAMEFQSLLQTKKMRTSKVLGVIGAFGISGVWVSLSRGSRVAAGVISFVSSLSALGICFSTGGVEDDDMDGNALDKN